MLDKIDKNKNPFKVPENYFDNLPDKIMKSLPEENKSETKKVSLWKKNLPWFSAAAAIVVILAAFNIITNSMSDDNTMTYTAEQHEKTGLWENAHEYTEEDYYLFLEEESIGDVYADIWLDEIN